MDDSMNTPSVEKEDSSQIFSFLLMLLLLVYLFALGYAERTVYFVDPARGLVLHAYLLVGLILVVSAEWDHAQYRYLLAFAIVPLMRMIGLAVPLSYFPLGFWYVLVSLALVVAVMIFAQRLALSSSDLGLKLDRLLVQLLVALSGILVGVGQYFLLGEALSTEGSRQFSSIALGVVLLLGYGFVEELIFRGLLQHVAEKILGVGVGWVFVAAVYAVLSLGSYSLGSMAVAFGVSLLFSWAVWRTGSLLGVSLAHGLANIVLFLILPGLNL